MVSGRRRSRLRQGVQEELIKYFCGGVPARSVTEIAGVIRGDLKTRPGIIVCALGRLGFGDNTNPDLRQDLQDLAPEIWRT